MYRIGIAGAASLAGKELADALAESALAAADLVLLDEEDAGQVVAAGDEANFIQKLDADSFAGLDFIFFVGDAALARRHWKTARAAGVSIVDMTYALEREPGVLVCAPWLNPAAATHELDLTTPAIVAAHPVALALGLLLSRVEAKLPLRSVAATVFEPASEHGRAAMDELHQQTVSLLSFQSLPREQYDAQVAFNLLPALGEAAKFKLSETKKRIAEHYETLGGGARPNVGLQVIQAPVFHGYIASLLLETKDAATVEQMELAAYGEHVDVVAAESEAPSNLTAAGQADILVRITSAEPAAGAARRFWVWVALDNLKLASLNAIACANELGRLRPHGKVQ